MLVLMVVNADQAEEALFAKGALEALAPSATVIVTCTCAPGRVEVMAARVEKTGRLFVDTPVLGGVAGAKGGTLTSPWRRAGRAVFERPQPVWAAMGSNLFYLGDKPGQGAAMKTVNQLLCGVGLLRWQPKAWRSPERAGIDPKLALEILSGSAAQSWMLKARGGRTWST